MEETRPAPLAKKSAVDQPRRHLRPKDGPQQHPARGGRTERGEGGFERKARTGRDEAPRRSARGEDARQRGDKPQRERQPRPAPKPVSGPLRLFAASPRGLEHELAKELAELGAESVQPGSGGVSFVGDIALAWKINLWSRLAIRVLQQVAHGRYQSEDDLYQAARALPWPEWFPLGRTIAVRTVAHRSPLKSLNFASLKIKDALCDRYRDVTGARPDVDAHNPDVPILLFLGEDSFTLYLDLTGEPLNRRGYRVQAAQAPLNENLAAGMLRLAGWTPEMPLLDPMMGGGTILLEAVLMALNIAPGLRRHFAFENLNSFDKVEWAKLRKNAQAAQLATRPLPIYGADIDPRMVWATETNLREAGLLDCVTLREADALEVQAPGKVGLIVSNPPYGVRLKPGSAATASSSEQGSEEDEDMAAFYRGLGDNLKQHFTGWSAYLLSADPELPQHIGLKATKRTPLFNGPLECRLYEYRLVSGQMRRKKSGES
ncbi:MAG: class I SAM-dependent RNA methyltransferase [Betaproteobacteria bacterium]|nr:class I SAM-dependent RNA methyltransferase [Betaproteobacteria bacterium]